jgi:hypothetical protein
MRKRGANVEGRMVENRQKAAENVFRAIGRKKSRKKLQRKVW